MPQSSIQHMHSMATTMAELTQQNQELTREIYLKKQHYERYAEGQAQSQEDRGNAEPEGQLRGTTSRRVPQLEREIDQMRKVMAEMRGKHKKGKPSRGSSPPNGFSFHDFLQWTPFASKVQYVFIGFVQWSTRPL